MSNQKKKMEELATKLENIYLTENPVNLNDNDYGYKYFLCWTNTHTVIKRTKNISDMIEEIENIIENGIEVGI